MEFMDPEVAIGKKYALENKDQFVMHNTGSF